MAIINELNWSSPSPSRSTSRRRCDCGRAARRSEGPLAYDGDTYAYGDILDVSEATVSAYRDVDVHDDLAGSDRRTTRRTLFT